MSGGLDRTSVSAILLIVLGAFAVANGAIGIAGVDWYEAVVLDVIDRSLGPESSAFLEASRGFTTRVIQVGWIIGLLGGLLDWLAAAAVLLRGRSWGRIAGLVVGAIGLFGAASSLLGYVMLPGWTAPLPALAWLDRDLAEISTVAATALSVAGYAATLVLLGRGRRGTAEGTVAVAN